jgi:hypothetical protein
LIPSLQPSGLPPEPEGGLPDRTGNLSGLVSFIELHNIPASAGRTEESR